MTLLVLSKRPANVLLCLAEKQIPYQMWGEMFHLFLHHVLGHVLQHFFFPATTVKATDLEKKSEQWLLVLTSCV